MSHKWRSGWKIQADARDGVRAPAFSGFKSLDNPDPRNVMVRPKHKIIVIAVAMGLASWIIDSILDYLVFYKPMGFLDLLILKMPSHELYIRSIIFTLFIVFGLVIYRYVDKVELSERRFHRLFDNVKDGVFVTTSDDQGAVKFTEVNSVACKSLGYSKEEMLHLSPDDLIEPGALTDRAALDRKFKEDKHILFETILRAKDGRKIWVEVNSHLFCLSGTPTVLSIMRDITVRKQAEAKLLDSERQLRTLAGQLLNIQETERRRISKELHDELGQAMMLLKYQLSAIHEKVKDRSLHKEFYQVLDYLDNAIENIRRLTKDLSPTVLENLGLTAAVGHLLEEFGRTSNIETCADIEDVDGLLSPQDQLNIYRVYQEALTNIGRHAQARHVSSVIKKKDGHIYIEIQDDGKGFDVKEVLVNHPKARSFGLATINERVRLIGGSLDLQSRAGTGTRICFSVPINGEANNVPLSHLVG